MRHAFLLGIASHKGLGGTEQHIKTVTMQHGATDMQESAYLSLSPGNVTEEYPNHLTEGGSLLTVFSQFLSFSHGMNAVNFHKRI